MLNKQAKVLSDAQVGEALDYVRGFSAFPLRDEVILLLSVYAGLRACEIARVRWRAVLTSTGGISDSLRLEGKMTKGGYGGRVIPIHSILKNALIALYTAHYEEIRMDPSQHIIQTLKSSGWATGSLRNWFRELYENLGYTGCTSHSGRRTLITKAARNIGSHGGSLRDVQQLAGHSDISTTQLYIDENYEAKQSFINSL